MFGFHGAISWRIARTGLAALVCATTATAQSDSNLVQAVKTGRTDIVQTLLEGGADPDIRQGDGATALHHAAHQNDVDSARLLIEAGATVSVSNELGATPLWLAATNGSAVMVERLLDAGADPNVALIMGETSLMTAAPIIAVAWCQGKRYRAGATPDCTDVGRRPRPRRRRTTPGRTWR